MGHMSRSVRRTFCRCGDDDDDDDDGVRLGSIFCDKRV